MKPCTVTCTVFTKQIVRTQVLKPTKKKSGNNNNPNIKICFSMPQHTTMIEHLMYGILALFPVQELYIYVCTTSIEFQCPIYLIFISLHYKTCNTEETLYLVSSDHGFIFEEYSLRLAK